VLRQSDKQVHPYRDGISDDRGFLNVPTDRYNPPGAPTVSRSRLMLVHL